MRPLFSSLIRILTIIILCSGSIAATKATGAIQDTNSFTREQINLSKIASFRENYIPREYFPLPESLVFADLSVYIAILITGLIFIIRKKPAKWLTWLAIITFVYIGFIRGGCICPMGLTTNVVMSIIDPYQVSIIGLILFITPLIIALIAGRVFCTAGCPLGAIQHLVYKRKKDYKIPAKFNRYIRLVPVVVLFATVYFALKGTYLGCVLDPYKPVFFTGKVWTEQGIAFMKGTPMEPKLLLSFGVLAWLCFIAVLVAGYWIQRPFCRFLCPYSALLGLTSLISFRQRKIDGDKCSHCSVCARKCPTQAININNITNTHTVSVYDCIQCNRCSDSCKLKAI